MDAKGVGQRLHVALCKPPTRHVQLLELRRQVLRDQLHRLCVKGLYTLEAELELAPATALEQLCSQLDGLARSQQATQRHYGETAAQDGVQRVVAFVSLGRLGVEVCLLGDGV